MKQLPRFVFISHPEIEGLKIMMTEHPYLVATEYRIGKHQEDLIDSFLEDMAQDRYPMAKIPGYYVFLRMFTSLEPNNDREFQQSILNEMAEFLLEARIQDKLGLYNKCCEGDKTLLERVQERDERVRLRPRKNK